MRCLVSAVVEWFRRELREIATVDRSVNERAYVATLASRPGRDDDEFYEQFYASTGISREIPIRLRKLFVQMLGDDLAALHPADNLGIAYDGVDFADVVHRIEKVFKVRIPLDTVGDGKEIDGTFDSIVRYLARHHGRSSATA